MKEKSESIYRTVHESVCEYVNGEQIAYRVLLDVRGVGKKVYKAAHSSTGATKIGPFKITARKA